MTLHQFIAQNVEKKLQFPEDFNHGLRLPVIRFGKYHDGNFANFHGRIFSELGKLCQLSHTVYEYQIFFIVKIKVASYVLIRFEKFSTRFQ